jgi:hypothetical protein
MELNAMGSDLSNFNYFNMAAKLDEKFRPSRNMQTKV